MSKNVSPQKKYCNHCREEVEPVVEILSEGTHYGKISCGECGRYIAFLPKPANEDKRRRNKYLPKDLGIDYCQMCLRHHRRLGARGVLHSHHVIEVMGPDVGQDIPENIWVLCTACHKLVHHQRTYLNEHLKDSYSIRDLRADMSKYNVPEEVKRIMYRIFNKQESL